MRVLVVGSLAYDHIETPEEKRAQVLGGSATYFSIGASLFAKADVVAVVGDDFLASDLQRLRDRGVSLEGVEQIVGGETFRWGGVYSRFFQKRTTLFTHLNVFEDFDPEIPDTLRGDEILFLANIHPSLQAKVLRQMGGSKFVAMDTMNFWIEGAREQLDEVIAEVDLLFINDEEAFLLADCGDIKTAGARIGEMGPRAVVIKRGEHGAWLFTEGEARFTPAVPLSDVVDPTGAGDSFAGGFLGYLAREERLDATAMQEAMVAGTLVASRCCQGFSVDALEHTTLDHLRARREVLAHVIGSIDVAL